MKKLKQTWKSGTIGKVIIGGISLFMLCCLCSIPIAIFSPNTPAPTPTELISNLVATEVQKLMETASPTITAISTNTSEPIATNTIVLLPTATIIQLAEGATCIPSNPPQTGKVIDVVDGDTIKVLMDQDGQTYTVRYIGMDTPESTTQVEFFGAEASAKNAELVYGKSVTLIKDVSETDPYGRLLRYVIADNLFINYELVAQGYANTASYPPDISCIPTFQKVEQNARASNLGLWNVPPTLAVVIPTLAPPVSSGSGGNAACNCNGPDLDCKDFSSHASAQACHDYCQSLGLGDLFRLDGNDNDGLACESLP